jgi:two-component system alkaline phosphatase synthesis response regulator PhoP
MEPLLCHPDPLPAEVALALEHAGYPYKACADARHAAAEEPEEGWSGAVVATAGNASSAFALLRALRAREAPVRPVLLVLDAGELGELEWREELFDDFCVAPIRRGELEARLAHLLFRTGRGPRPDVIVHGPLTIDLATYQASVAGRRLDLTYMEYELLRFLAAHPHRVFTRQALLSRVWGYEYYGGARTVDVHVRRLRAKLGEEHAHLIQTVRSVGYSFGETREPPGVGERRQPPDSNPGARP